MTRLAPPERDLASPAARREAGPADRGLARLAALARLWARGIVDPAGAMRSLPAGGRAEVGLATVAVRFAVQDLVETLPLAVLGRQPFMPAKVPIAPENHYRAQLVYSPPLGIVEWLVMGRAAHGLLHLTGRQTDVRRVMDVIGLGMFVPMPALWIADAALIATDRFELPALGFVNVPVQAWETVLFAIGLHALPNISWGRAVLAATGASAVYVLGASQLLR